MPYTLIELNEIQCFGTTKANMLKQLESAYGDIQSIIMSVLSDAQEEIVRGNAERARQLINVAKFLTSRTRGE